MQHVEGEQETDYDKTVYCLDDNSALAHSLVTLPSETEEGKM